MAIKRFLLQERVLAHRLVSHIRENICTFMVVIAQIAADIVMISGVMKFRKGFFPKITLIRI